MKKKKLSPLWLIPAVVIVALILWCIRFPLTMFAGLRGDTEPLSATVLVDQVPETPAITFTTNDTEQLSEIMEQLRSVRGRFMGWFSMITYNDDPLLHLIVTGNKGKNPYHLSLCVDSDGYLYVQEGNTRLLAKDAALYDYLTELAARHDGVVTLNNGWNYTPQDDMRDTVRSAILGEGEKESCYSVEFHYAIQDSDAKQWAVEKYTDFYDGWTENYLKANMAAVRASYTVEYDGTKTPLPSGKIERVFLLFINKETGKWEIWESAEMPLGEKDTVKTVAANYVEKLSRVIYLYEDIDLAENTVLTYDDSPEMQYVVEKSEELKARRVAEGHFRTDWGSMYSTDVMEFSEDSATVLVWEDIGFRYEGEEFSSSMGNEYTVTLKKLDGEWLVSSVEGGDTYSLKEMETYQYRKAMPELYAQAGVEAFSFRDTLSVQVTNVIKTEKRVLPAEDNFEYEVYTVLPGAEIEVLHAAVEDTVELGPLGIWKVYSKDGTLQYLESGMPNIPITENINVIGAESVCILVFELYTGEG